MHGALAQLGEHLLCKQRVTGSIPVRSTKNSKLERRTFSKIVDIVYKCVKIHETFLGFFQVREKQDIQLSTENSLSKSKNLLTKFYSILE